MKQNLPFSQSWIGSATLPINLYPECPEAWMRCKREIAKGWPVLLIPYDMDVSLARFPVGNKDVLITDLHGISKKKAKVIGIAVIQAGASAAIYLGPQNRSILFQPEVTE